MFISTPSQVLDGTRASAEAAAALAARCASVSTAAVVADGARASAEAAAALAAQSASVATAAVVAAYGVPAAERRWAELALGACSVFDAASASSARVLR